MTKPRPTLSVSTRRRAVSGLDRLGREWSAALAETVRVRSLNRREALTGEIKAYASALLRARMGILSTGREAHNPVRSAAGVPPSPPPPPDAPSGKALSAARGNHTVESLGQRHAVSSAMLDRFCQLTGVSRSHLGGNGSNLAGIAFYFGAFAILTAGRDISLERLERLLDQLRACREAIDQFVTHRLSHIGWTASDQGERDLRAALQALESAGVANPPRG